MLFLATPNSSSLFSKISLHILNLILSSSFADCTYIFLNEIKETNDPIILWENIAYKVASLEWRLILRNQVLWSQKRVCSLRTIIRLNIVVVYKKACVQKILQRCTTKISESPIPSSILPKIFGTNRKIEKVRERPE